MVPSAQAAYALSNPDSPHLIYPATTARCPAFTPLLPPNVRAELEHAHIPLSAVSVAVKRIGDPCFALSLNTQKRMNPASTMKLLTTFASLSLLGPDFQWETRAYTDGPIQEGVLYGNLYIYGTGDPKLIPETLVHFVTAIRNAGITHIEGDLVLDRSYFDPRVRSAPPFNPKHEGDAAYNVRPDPLLYAFNALTFTLTPQPDYSVQIRVQPETTQLQVTNTLHVTDDDNMPCSALKPDIIQQGHTLRVGLQGSYSLKCGVRTMSQAAPNPNTFFAEGFLSLWTQAGGTHLGTVREATIPKHARGIALYKGETLQNSVRDINKYSNNIMARNLFLTLGALYDQPPATLARSERAIRTWLYHIGLCLPGLVLENGAGLSYKERISAQGLALLLQQAYRSPVAAPFIESLPIAGLDGTMRHRLAEDAYKSNIRIKTGSLDHVRAIAGYVTAHNAQMYAVVSFINHPNASQAQAAHDALLRWIYSTAP